MNIFSSLPKIKVNPKKILSTLTVFILGSGGIAYGVQTVFPSVKDSVPITTIQVGYAIEKQERTFEDQKINSITYKQAQEKENLCKTFNDEYKKFGVYIKNTEGKAKVPFFSKQCLESYGGELNNKIAESTGDELKKYIELRENFYIYLGKAGLICMNVPNSREVIIGVKGKK